MGQTGGKKGAGHQGSLGSMQPKDELRQGQREAPRLIPVPGISRLGEVRTFRKAPKAFLDALFSRIAYAKVPPVAAAAAAATPKAAAPVQVPRGRGASQARPDSSPGDNIQGEGAALGGGRSVASWKLLPEIEDRLREMFNMGDKKDDGITEDERDKIQDLLSGLLIEYGLGPATYKKLADKTDSFEQVCSIFVREWETASKVQALPGDELLRLIAEMIPGGSVASPLGSLAVMTVEEVDETCRKTLVPAIKSVLLRKREQLILQELRDSQKPQEQNGNKNGKFFVAKFGKLADFHGGIAAQIGLPNPKLMEGMEAEHTRRPDSNDTFEPGNYDITTTPYQEWQVVTDEDEARKASIPPRRVRVLADLMKEGIVAKAQLKKVEVIALLLYTGPMFAKYNAVLRGFPQPVVEKLKGNQYTTTIYCIVSGIIKLSRVMRLPVDRKAYRGLGGVKLPDEFTKCDEYGVRGGVEFALMSTTLDRYFDRNVAMQYAGNNLATIFEINLGAIDRGASISFLSQYPGEEEILLPPRSYLEVQGGMSRTEEGPNGRMIRIVSLKVNANATSSTIEQIVSRRRDIFLSAGDNCIHEIRSKVNEVLTSSEVRQVLSHRLWDHKNNTHVKLADSIFKEVEDWLARYKERDSDWFNNEWQYARASRELGALEKMSVGKLKYWLGEAGGGDALLKLPMQNVQRQDESEIRRKLDDRLGEEKRGVAGAAEKGAMLALELCKRRGAVIDSIDEKNDLGESPIVSAGARGDVVDLRLLLAAGADVNSQSDDGSTALHKACLMGHLGFVQSLYEAKADFAMRDNEGHTSLHLAMLIGHSEVVRQLLRWGGKDLGMMVTKDLRSSALVACHRHGAMEELEALIEVCGIEVLALQDDYGRSCARKAAGSGHVPVLKWLVEKAGKQHLMIRLHKGSSCAMVAVMNDHLGILQYLREAGGKELLLLSNQAGWTCEIIASEHGHLEILKYLVQELGVERLTNTTTDTNFTCVSAAAQNGYTDVLMYLFEMCGMDLFMVLSVEGESCAFLAAKNGRLEVVRYLSEIAGGRGLFDIKAADGTSCIDAARAAGHLKIAEYIEEMSR